MTGSKRLKISSPLKGADLIRRIPAANSGQRGTVQSLLLRCAIILLSVETCVAQSLPDDLAGNWITDSGNPLIFYQSVGSTVRGWVPGVPAEIVVSRAVEEGSNLKLSGPNLECFYFVSPVEKGYVWNLLKGNSGCPDLKHIIAPRAEADREPRKDTEKQGPQKTFWVISGAITYLVYNGSNVEIYYDSPTEELRTAGFASDTPKFIGHKNGLHYEGEAYVFTKHCPRVLFPYDVSGVESADHKVITLKGPAPVVDPSTCEIHHLAWGSGSTMEFRAYDQEISSNRTTHPGAFSKRDARRKS